MRGRRLQLSLQPSDPETLATTSCKSASMQDRCFDLNWMRPGLEAGMGGLAAPASVCWCIKWGQALEGPQVPPLGFPATSPDPRPHFLELQHQALLAGPSLYTWLFRCLLHFHRLLFPRCSPDTWHRCLPPTLPLCSPQKMWRMPCVHTALDEVPGWGDDI